MIFCFSGTGNSRYIARRFAEALKDTVVDLNAKIKAQDNSLIQTGKNVIIVVPTYAWRIPRVVSEWLTKTELASAECIWFVMDCGSEIGNAAKYNRHLAEIYGDGTSRYAGELHCHVWRTGGRGSCENCGESKP